MAPARGRRARRLDAPRAQRRHARRDRRRPARRRGRGDARARACSARSPRERLPVAYAAADALVLPSIPTPRFREPWGLVCNEALHQGTPVVATTAVGAVAGGLVRDGETGLVVAARRPAALAAAIARLLADPALRARLGAAGRAALAGHTYAAMADAFGVALARAGALRLSGLLPEREERVEVVSASRPRTRAASASS